MKKISSFAGINAIHFLIAFLISIFLSPSSASALGGGGHQYMTEEAAFLFKMDHGIFPALEEYLPLVGLGARHEDQKDHVWDHGGWYVDCP